MNIVKTIRQKAGINNLLSIMSAVTGRNIESIVKDYSGKGYGDFKNDVAEAVVECIRPIRNEYDKLIADKQYLMDICQRGADSAKRISQRTLKKGVIRKSALCCNGR